MSATTTEQSESSNCLSAVDRTYKLREIADLTGEKFTVECRLQWINNRIDNLRTELAATRRHGNSKE